VLLAALGLALATRLGLGLLSWRGFALVGALYGTTLVLARRPRVSTARALGFIALAALLSAATAGLAVRLSMLGAPPALAAAAGGLGYALAARGVLALPLDAIALGVLALVPGCATVLALATPALSPFGIGWWLAIWWWLGFSAPLLAVAGGGGRPDR
jgi:hypothetical protein